MLYHIINNFFCVDRIIYLYNDLNIEDESNSDQRIPLFALQLYVI